MSAPILWLLATFMPKPFADHTGNERAEWEDYHQSVSQWEIDKYARFY